MKDNELFELCKQVHEATGWGKPGEENIKLMSEELDLPPIYTSDYLLEKLPHTLELEGYHYVGDNVENEFYLEMEVPDDKNGWSFYYTNGGELHLYVKKNQADTPLKALLKLTLALHKEGLLK